MSTQTRMAPWLEQAWLDRYLERELDGAEREWFEEYILDKPELARRIDADTDLRDALHAQAQARASASNEPSAAHRAPRVRTGFRWAAPLALAATLVVGVGIGALTRYGGSHGAMVVGNPTRVLYDTVRGAAMSPHVDHAESASTHVLIDVAVPPGASDVVLHFEGAPAQALVPSSDGIVTALVARSVIEGNSKGVLTFRANGASHERELPTTLLHRRDGR